MSWIFKDEPPMPANPKAARKRAMLLASPFALLGIVALVMFLHDELIGGMPRQRAIATLSFVATCVGFVALIIGINAKKMAMTTAGAKPAAPETPDKPWLKRADWASGRIASGSRKSVVLLWIFTLFWCGISGAICLVAVPPELHRGNHAALIALVFPIIGLVLVGFALNTTLAWRKFGRSIFEMAAIPGALGGTLDGEIQVKTKLQPLHGLQLRLSCIRQITTGSGKNRTTKEITLWQDEKWLRPDLPQTGLNATGIPVYFKLPDNLPESTPAKGDGIHWRLEASAKLRGPNFHATFDVPVFKPAELPAPSDDPTLQYQMSLDEVRKQIHSKIQVNNLPDGTEFIFPAARNPASAAGLTLIWLVFFGVFIVLLWQRAPIIFAFFCGAIVLLIGFFVADLWFRRSRVLATRERATIQTSWLFFKKERSLNAADITGISAEPGMTFGHEVYSNLKIHVRDDNSFEANKAKFLQTGRRPTEKFSVSGPSGITAANNIAHKAEADWLVQQMIAAIKESPATGPDA